MKIKESFKGEINKFKKHFMYYEKLCLEIEKSKNNNSMKFKRKFY